MKTKDGSGDGAAATTATHSLENLLQRNSPPEESCVALATTFKVEANEVALYRLEKGFLHFLYPLELKTAGLIPLSSSAAVSAHTANSKKTELFNNFPKVKHASVFEHIKLSSKQENPPDQMPIQKLMSAPVIDEAGDLLGVIQICRKGWDSACGADFTLENLHQLEASAKVLARAAFMQPANI